MPEYGTAYNVHKSHAKVPERLRTGNYQSPLRFSFVIHSIVRNELQRTSLQRPSTIVSVRTLQE